MIADISHTFYMIADISHTFHALTQIKAISIILENNVFVLLSPIFGKISIGVNRSRYTLPLKIAVYAGFFYFDDKGRPRYLGKEIITHNEVNNIYEQPGHYTHARRS